MGLDVDMYPSGESARRRKRYHCRLSGTQALDRIIRQNKHVIGNACRQRTPNECCHLVIPTKNKLSVQCGTLQAGKSSTRSLMSTRSNQTARSLVSDDIRFNAQHSQEHYILSRHFEGGSDNKDPKTKNRRTFRNIGNSIVNLAWRAKNIDRKKR